MAIVIGGWTFRPELISFGTARAEPRPASLLAQQSRDIEYAQTQFAAKTAELRDSLAILRDALGNPRSVHRPISAHQTGTADLRSSTAARLISSQELNTRTTEFGPINPAWQGNSQADPTVGGVYDGAQGTDTLSVHVISGGVRGVRDLELELRDSAGSPIEQVSMPASDPDDALYPLANGLTLQFTTGRLAPGDVFTIGVQTGLDFEIDPTAAFDGSGGDPGFDAGEAVAAGSFTVNGVVIDVLASDSVSSVLARIESSGAGVTAAYDAAAEAVTLAQKTPGAQPTIVVGNDTSGFLSAIKLDDAIVAPGHDGGPDAAISSLPAFAGVVVGSVLVNGVAVSIDPAQDSIADIIDRLNNSAAGVVVRLVRDREVVIRNRDARAELELASNGTQFFEAMQIMPGTVAPSLGARRVGRSAINAINDATRGLVRAYKRFLTFDPYVSELAETKRIRASAESAFAGALKLAGLDEHDIGIVLTDTDTDTGTPRAFEVRSARSLENRLRADFASMQSFYVGMDGSSGFVGRLMASLDRELAALPANVRLGAIVDRLA